ncbi:MAG: WD40 repeat domain-containing protein [Chloroflexi bacterium]|nr:WD40 repeat domain-containing protein [Chloroflexota bacterium]
MLRFYETASGEERVELAERFSKPSVAIAFSPDGSRLAVGQKFTDTINHIVVYDFETGAEMTRLLYQTSTNLVNSLTFSPDWTLIAAITDENRLHVWDAATGDLLFDEPGLCAQQPSAFQQRWPDDRHHRLGWVDPGLGYPRIDTLVCEHPHLAVYRSILRHPDAFRGVFLLPSPSV